MAKSPNAWGFSLFCDDIRHEVGAKVSVLGIYQSDMQFPADAIFPLIIPKFGILVKYYEVPDTLKDDLVLRVFLPGNEKPAIQQAINRIDYESEYLSNLPLEKDQERVKAYTFPMLFGPLPILAEGFVKVRMFCGEVVTNLGSLWIHKALPAEPPKAS